MPTEVFVGKLPGEPVQGALIRDLSLALNIEKIFDQLLPRNASYGALSEPVMCVAQAAARVSDFRFSLRSQVIRATAWNQSRS